MRRLLLCCLELGDFLNAEVAIIPDLDLDMLAGEFLNAFFKAANSPVSTRPRQRGLVVNKVHQLLQLGHDVDLAFFLRVDVQDGFVPTLELERTFHVQGHNILLRKNKIISQYLYYAGMYKNQANKKSGTLRVPLFLFCRLKYVYNISSSDS